jgi:hypothetical protein
MQMEQDHDHRGDFSWDTGEKRQRRAGRPEPNPVPEVIVQQLDWEQLDF